MADVFTVGALALAAEGANAVGAVRITLLENDIEIELVRAARFERGFVMASVAEAAPMRVPYAAVRGLVRRGRALCLALDPKVATPHTRFTLAHFTQDPRRALARAYLTRRRVGVFVALVPLVLGAVAAKTLPPSLVSGALGRASAAVLVAIASWFVFRELHQMATWGGAASHRLSVTFERSLCSRLGLAPSPVAMPAEPPLFLPEVAPPSAPGSSNSSAWIRAAFAVLAASAAIVLAVAFFRKYSKPPDESQRVYVKRRAERFSSVWTAASVEAFVPPKPRLPRCVCARPSSALWNDGIAALEVLFASKPDDGSGVVTPSLDRRNRPRFDFDVSVVNNAATSLPDVTVLLTFSRRDEATKRVSATDRGLYFAGPLLPARAVKWHVKAPGAEIRVEPSVTGKLDPDRSPAPADAYFELSSAKQRIVRIHAAKMLAYHRDERAREVLTNLGAANPGEEKILARIHRAMTPVFACDFKPAPDSLDVCLVNTTLSPAQVTALVPLSPDDEPLQTQPTTIEVPVHDGVRVKLPISVKPLPAEIGLEIAK